MTAPSPCTWCGAEDMEPRTMRPLGLPSFVRWFCECGSSHPESVLLRHASKALTQ